ncbi:hypothetical protein H9W90_11635 [Polaribacter pectinis]|uniref:Uncharacterized protein n=1 Tax=Polaribacter pectinis TaxID=2738844 RepID=A0A7G9L891_9FLAO|nr:hypothetical protein [Polaribacter pectinis]QNM84840.1 hypothetical protein H9W90_11635 [Polaribacter pectinis]
MELSEAQIQRIEHYLNVKNITYIDVRLEVLDHIISDVEKNIKEKEVDFEAAFYIVTDKWNSILKETSSFYFGIVHSAPKIVMEKAKNHFKVHFWIMIILSLSISFGDKLVKYSFSNNMQSYFNYGFKFLGLICLIYSSILLYRKKKDKLKTSYSFILKTQSLGILFAFFHLPLSTYFTETGTLNTLSFIFLIGQLQIMYVFFIFYKKHKEAVKRYKIS